MNCNNDRALDIIIDRISVDLCTTGRPKPADVLLWAVERWPEGFSYPSADVARWFAHDFRPIVEASLQDPS